MVLSTSQKIFIAKMANRGVSLVRRALGQPMRAQFRRGGLQWELDLDEGIDFSIYLLGSFEPDLVHFYRSRIREGDTVVDIGANIGAHTLHFARIVGPRGKVLAVEPTNYAMAKLVRNIGLNPELARVVDVAHVFLAASEGSSAPAVSSSWPLTGATDDPVLVGARLQSTEGASATTLERLVRERSLDRIDWIKLDVDGHELEVLKGGAGILERLRPRILMELAPYCHPGAEFEELVALLTNLGYRFHDIASGKEVSADPSVLRKSIPALGGINVWATC